MLDSDTGIGVPGFSALEQVPACPYCGETAHRRTASAVEDWFFGNVQGGFNFERCDACESLWVSARLGPNDLPKAYEFYYTHTPAQQVEPPDVGLKARLRSCYVRSRYGGRSDLMTQLGAAVYRRLAPGLVHVDDEHRFAPPPPARLLDYGCGGGAFLRKMQRLGYAATGVDFDPVTLGPLRAEGIAAFSTEEIHKREWEARFDCVTLCHVIEHVADPVGLISDLAKLLRPGGVLYCEAPNAHATGLDVFDRYWRGLEAPRHLTIPSRDGLLHALAAAGLVAERWVHRDWVRSLTWPLSLGAVPPSETADYERRVLGAAEETIESAEYLIVVARKPLHPRR
jgi:2-polyprenyl-3-methyl-5-hydroxy-6-metoxy-1,4-benzoquinol methylase